jgi:drug/metabolite transporter (DMT)-like permease
MFTALVAFAFYGEKIGGRHFAALLAGFAGVVILASAKVAGASTGLAVLAGTAAAFLYGVGVNLVKRKLAGLPPTALAAATLGCAALVLLPFAIATWPRIQSAPRPGVRRSRWAWSARASRTRCTTG